MTKFDTSSPRDLFEIMNKIAAAPNRKVAVETMQKYDCLALRDILKGTFDPSVKWLVDPEVTYVATREESVPSTLLRQTDKLKYFVEFKSGPNMRLNSMLPKKRESIFVGLLESIHPLDAKILLDAVNKKSNYRNVIYSVAREAFPDLWVEESTAPLKEKEEVSATA